MPWYPVKDYGDFVIKLQWRDSSTGTSGNGGVFVRFPNPVEAAARPAANRYPCQVGSAQSDPAWVAIYCGHEIQINDNQPSEPQKTGSVYNFSPLNATQAKVQPRGTWVDYEIRVVGQTYTITRNGEVLQVFENTPGKQSSRSGDPSTTDRQFLRGFIGLQNHGASDVDRLPQHPRAAAGRGLGPGAGHGLRQRRAQGRVPLDRRGGQRGDDQVGRLHDRRRPDGREDPAGDHELAQPGRAGRGRDLHRSGGRDAVGDRSGGDRQRTGGPAVTHDVNALPAAWDPAAVTAKVGDTVRWNFPAATAGAPHDLWLIKPGEAPLSDGTLLVTGDLPIVLPGGPSITNTVTQAGTYTFVCKIHGHKGATDWEGMVGKITVTSGSSTVPGSGVDYTEYRVNGGAWTKKANTANASPFLTTFKAEAEGDYAIEYRSADKAGNVEATKSVALQDREAVGLGLGRRGRDRDGAAHAGHHARGHGAVRADHPGCGEGLRRHHHGDGHVEPGVVEADGL